MAILNKIRQRTLVLIVVIAMALFAFVLTDLFRNSDALLGGSADVVGTINGKDIKRNEFAFRVENAQRGLRGNSSSLQAVNSVWNQELEKAIMSTEFDELGLTVENAQMMELLKPGFGSYPEFQNEAGTFDEGKLKAFVANLEAIRPERAQLGTFQINYDEWTNNEQSIAARGLKTSYYNLIKAGVGATLGEAEADYALENQTRDLSFVFVPYTSIADSLVAVTKSDINDFVKKNPEDYKVEASKEVKFVEFQEIASAQDEEDMKANLVKSLNTRVDYSEAEGVTIADTIVGFLDAKDVSEYVNLNSDINYNDTFTFKADLVPAIADSIFKLNVGEYYGPYKDGAYYKVSKVVVEKQIPDSVTVRHILIPFVGGQRAAADVTKTDEQAKKTADSIYNVITSRSAKFLDLLELSSDKVSNEKDGEIEFDYKAAMAPEFKDFSFENNVGDLEVVKTSFGYHIIEILKQNAKNRALKIATIAKTIEASLETEDQIFNNVQKFEIALKDGDLETLAKEQDLTVRPVTFGKMDENIPGLGFQRQIVKWSFEDGTDIGDYKRFSIPGKGFVIVQLVNETEEGLMSAENASAIALNEIRNAKKAQMIREKITGTTVADVAKNQSQSRRTAAAVNMKNPTLAGAGPEPLVVGAAFGLNEGETSKLIDGEKGVFMVEVTKVNEFTPLDNYSAIANRLSTARVNGAQSKVYNALKEVADIDDNRATFY
ncbi:SurA N-terminal domain-containing protein [Ichthyenterobacterium sp. W332]|uniref:Periplasmic chaperone PpiD n=1 Tax=Microcosmobacter mediterraneus TaxID=3075607 RepID=A0ABU2YKS4_9FLAO|nr:peptidylprolyl isomerase [Ichthyenterobacterium sp. W332]MDT0558491.1 SurA N-terminal domain-containing protein [Ichthyenterobacterium sp. W332]